MFRALRLPAWHLPLGPAGKAEARGRAGLPGQGTGQRMSLSPVTLASRQHEVTLLSVWLDSGQLCSCRAAWSCLGASRLSATFFFCRQTDSFAHWNSRAGGAAVKINTWQLIGGLRAVFWGLPGSRTPSLSGCPGLNPGRGRWACPFAAWESASPALWVSSQSSRLLAGLVCSPSPT